MELTPQLVAENAEEYHGIQPLSAVESQHFEILPEMFHTGEYGWRDLEWVIQWYYRRYLGAYPDTKRRQAEEAFGENTYEDVSDALVTVSGADSADAKIDALTRLDGVDVPVASAYLFFMFPDEYLAVDDRQWGVLEKARHLDVAYPDPPTVEEYLTYLDVCRRLTERFDIDLVTLYRALWRLGAERIEVEPETDWILRPDE